MRVAVPSGQLPLAGSEHAIMLPDSPALVAEGGVIVQANLAAARLAGRRLPDSLIGLSLRSLLVDAGTEAELLGPDGRGIPVRLVRWDLPGTGLVLIFLVDVSDLRSASDALRTERRRLDEVERVAGIGSWEYDPATGSTRWSTGHFTVLGLEPGSVACGMEAVLRMIHPEDRDRVARMWAEHREAGVPVDTEYRILAPGGETRTIRARIRAQHDESGRRIRHTGCVWDVTGPRGPDAELAGEHLGLLRAQRIARIGSFTWDWSSGEFSYSPTLAELFCREGDVLTDPFQLIHPEDLPGVLRTVQELVSRPGIDPGRDCVDNMVEGEFRGLPEFGDTAYLYRLCADRREGDPSLRLVGTVQDVTAQRVTETRMRRSSRRFADLVAVAPVGIALFDDTDRLVDANDALCGLLDYERDTLRGLSLEVLTHPEERVELLRTRRTCQAAGSRSYTVPQRTLLRSDGVPVYCELQISESVQDDGRRFMLVVFTDITERRRVAEALRYQATHDHLTGLLNRPAIRDTLAELAADPDRDLAVLFCDVANFTRVNDSLGHDAGDELLVALAQRLRDGVPAECAVGRLSGDVYVVICSDVTAQGGIRALVSTVSELLHTEVAIHDQLVRVSAAIGVAVTDELTGGAEDLLRFADAALSQAKRRGNGHVAMANAALVASADRQVELEGQLREALAQNELRLHYQPVVGPDGQVLTVEALLRWPHPTRGMLLPEVVLPIAEQGGLMRELDCWVLRTALQAAQDWFRPDGVPVSVAVNLAGLVPGDASFVSTVTEAVEASGLAWDRVILELVETAFVGLPCRTRKAMDELVERGVRFAVDDFGTGYSSLARLKELPTQIVKLDRRFVAGVGVDPSDFAVARAVVDIARATSRSCVAEGVETETQFQVLRGLGVDAYQGWLLSRPLLPADIPPHLTQGPLL